MSDYLHDILSQPQALRDTLANLREWEASRALAAQLADGHLSRVVLTGMGGSYWVLHPLYLRLIAHGVMVNLIETSELLYHTPALLDRRALVIAVSQSGRSAEIIRLLELEHGPLIGVTNSADSPLALQADALVLTQAGTESTVSCKTYVTALTALALLGDVLTGAPTLPTRAALEAAPEAAAAYLSGWEAHVRQLCDRLTDTRHVIITGRGASLAAAGTGGLILKESAHFPSEGMSSAAFRHGPLEMISPAMLVMVYAGTPVTEHLNRRLVDDIRAAGAQSALVVEAAAPTDAFTLPPTAEHVRPILEILPAQMLSLALARLRGHEAGRFQRATKVTQTE